MRVLAVVAVCAGLSGCVSETLSMGVDESVAVEHDAHCQSLRMGPGTLVYIQCRLALLETLHKRYDPIERNAEALGGTPPDAVRFALRDDNFCNFNKSAELSLEPGDAASLAVAAYDSCADNQERLRQAVLEWQPAAAESFMADYRQDVLAMNEATIEDARAVTWPGTPPA